MTLLPPAVVQKFSSLYAMATPLSVSGNLKREIYESLLLQVKALLEGEEDTIANLSNMMSALKHGMKFLWVGIYFVKKDELVLGPFQGTVACTRIKKGKGVCGTAWEKKEILIVPDVNKFAGHIACSTESKSEMVLPCMKNGEVFALLDVDSDKLNDFDATDKVYLQKVVYLIEMIS